MAFPTCKMAAGKRCIHSGINMYIKGQLINTIFIQTLLSKSDLVTNQGKERKITMCEFCAINVTKKDKTKT